jgi:hypothetical protein
LKKAQKTGPKELIRAEKTDVCSSYGLCLQAACANDLENESNPEYQYWQEASSRFRAEQEKITKKNKDKRKPSHNGGN